MAPQVSRVDSWTRSDLDVSTIPLGEFIAYNDIPFKIQGYS